MRLISRMHSALSDPNLNPVFSRLSFHVNMGTGLLSSVIGSNEDPSTVWLARPCIGKGSEGGEEARDAGRGSASGSGSGRLAGGQAWPKDLAGGPQCAWFKCGRPLYPKPLFRMTVLLMFDPAAFST